MGQYTPVPISASTFCLDYYLFHFLFCFWCLGTNSSHYNMSCLTYKLLAANNFDFWNNCCLMSTDADWLSYPQIIFMIEPTSRVMWIPFNLQWSHRRLITLKSSVWTPSLVALMLEQRLKKRRENKQMPTDRLPLNELQRMLYRHGDQS